VALAPKLSALREALPRDRVEIVALYMQTCDGTDDLQGEMANEVSRMKLTYPVLNAESGTLTDPTRKRYPWAPHGVLIDRQGNILRGYGDVQTKDSLKSDLADLVATGRVAQRKDDGWSGFARGSRVTLRRDGETNATVTRTLRRANSAGAVITELAKPDNGAHVEAEVKISADRRAHEVTGAKWKDAGKRLYSVGDREIPCRVVERSWTTKNEWGIASAWKERLTVATQHVGGDRLMERRFEGPGLGNSRRTMVTTTRVVALDSILKVGDREVHCRVEESESNPESGKVRTWSSPVGGSSFNSTERVVDFEVVDLKVAKKR